MDGMVEWWSVLIRIIRMTMILMSFVLTFRAELVGMVV